MASPISTSVPSANSAEDFLNPVALGQERIVGGIAIVGHMLGRPEDRGIAGAAAEIALQRLGDFGPARHGIAHVERIERHDDAGRAEAALRAMVVEHRLLDRVEAAGPAAKMLDGHDVAAVERGDEADAGRHRFIDEFALEEAPDQHGAGAAIALGAALLRAGQPKLEPQVIEKRPVRPQRAKPDDAVVEKETDVIALFSHRRQLPL